MALIKIEPYIIDATGDFTFNNVTATGNLSSLNANLGNAVTANYFIGSGANLTNLPGGNISGTVSTATTSGTVTTASQPNITSVGSLTGLTVSNATGTVNLSNTANVSLGAVGNVHITGGSSGQYLQTDGSGTLSWATVTSGSTSNISNGNSNVNIPSANGNINLSAVGNTTMVVTGTGVNVAGTLNVTGNATVGNLVTSGSGGTLSNINVVSANTFTASGNITAGNANLGNAVTANYFIGNFYGTANLATYATTANAVAGANVSGQVGNALVAGTVYTAAQPNITSVGTLTGLTSNGVVNFANTSNTTLGAVGNVHITGGSSGQYLQTDGSGTLSWATVTSGSSSNISNGNSNVNIPSSNGNVNISSAGNANILVVTGTGANITGTLNVTGNATVGNLLTSGSGGNISNVNVISANTFTASGNITAGNFVTSGSGGNITGGNVISANTFTASGNITAGNANLGNAVTANYFTGTLTTAAQPNITNVGSLTGLTVSNATGLVNFTTTANVTLGAVGNLHISGGTSGQYLQTDGSGTLSWATVSSGSTSNISNGNSNVNIPSANGNVNISAVGNANILVVTGTGVNVAGTLNVTGNATVGNLVTSGSGGTLSNINVVSANTFTASGNITAGNANLGNAVTANYFIGNFYGTANSATSATTAGTVTTAAQPNITSVGTLSSLTVSGNGTFGNILGPHANGNSNVNIPAANGNINLTAVGNTTMVVTGTGVNIAGTLNATGNASLGNLVTSGSGGNITNANVISANTFTASGNITAGNANLGNAVTANYFTGTLTTAAQPNITSVGTLTGLTSNGVVNFANTSNTTLGAVGNVHISGGTTGQYLQTDGSGTLSWATVTSGSSSNISNGNSNVSIATANGNITMSAVGNANVVVVTGTGLVVTGTANVSGNLSAGNINAGSGSGGSITGGNLVSANYFTGTLTTAAQPNITSVGSLTGLTVSNATGVVNFTTTANVTLGAVGNVHITGGTSGQYLQTDGSGTLSWATVISGSSSNISNGNSNVSIATANGNINLTAVGNTTMVVTGTGVNVAGTLNTTGNVALSGANVSLGAVGNVKITGGSNTYLLSTDGAGNLSWTAPPAGANVTVDNFTGNGVQTVFTLSTTPTGINQTSVNYNGATVLRTDYTLANANITFSSAPANGSLIEVTTINLTSGGGGGASSAAAVGYSLIFGG